MNKKNNTVVKDIVLILLFTTLIIIPAFVVLTHPIFISWYYHNPLWLFLYVIVPVEIYAFVLYFLLMMSLLFNK